MKLAIIPGFNVLVPQGKLVGGTFKKTPLCSRARRDRLRHQLDQLPREECRRPSGAIFGIADQPGMTVGCVNPARPGARDWVAARQLLVRALDAIRCPAARSGGRARARRRRPTCRTEGLVSAQVRQRRPARLSVDPHQRRPGDKRTDRIGGEVGVLGMFLPGWGMHLADMAEAQGDLIREVGEISARSRTAARRCRPSASASLIASDGRGREHAVLDRVDGLARDADPFGELGLGQAKLGPPFLQRLASRSAIPMRAPFEHRRSGSAPRQGRTSG